MNVRILGRLVDERFLTHRLKSTSLAGIAGGISAIVLFEYRLFATGIWSWDLLGIALTFVCVKLAAMAWYRFTD
jgi:hypothetical protein